MEAYTNEEGIKYMKLDNGRERHCRMVFSDNGRGVDDEKAILHANRWDVCT